MFHIIRMVDCQKPSTEIEPVTNETKKRLTCEIFICIYIVLFIYYNIPLRDDKP